jgi:hypothetical protein
MIDLDVDGSGEATSNLFEGHDEERFRLVGRQNSQCDDLLLLRTAVPGNFSLIGMNFGFLRWFYRTLTIDGMSELSFVAAVRPWRRPIPGKRRCLCHSFRFQRVLGGPIQREASRLSIGHGRDLRW